MKKLHKKEIIARSLFWVHENAPLSALAHFLPYLQFPHNLESDATLQAIWSHKFLGEKILIFPLGML